MGFQDLADDDFHQPLTEPTLVANMLDLVVSAADRRMGAIAVLMCDDDGRLVQPAIVGELGPDQITEEDRERLVSVFVRGMGGHGSLLLAIARRDGLSISPEDVAWCHTAVRVCGGGGVRLLGVYVVTMSGSREVPYGDAVAV
jgi:hypothetical protein